MSNENTLRAGLLSKEVRDVLKASPYESVDAVIENDEVKLKKSQLQNAFEELNQVIKDDFEKIGVVDEKTALEYFDRFRHGQN